MGISWSLHPGLGVLWQVDQTAWLFIVWLWAEGSSSLSLVSASRNTLVSCLHLGSIIMSLNRLRNIDSSKPASDRRDDRTLYKPSSSRTPTLEEDIIPLTNSISTSRNNSFKMKALDPRRLSVRLKRSSTSTSPTPPLAPYDQHNTSTLYQSHTDSLPVSRHALPSPGTRAEFIYKPIHRTDYTAVVAETATAQSRLASRYHYNHLPTGPASGKHMGRGNRMEERTISSQSRSRSRSRAQPQARAHYAPYGENEINAGDDLYNDLDEEYTSVARPRRDYAAELYTLAAEKRCHRAARRLTTVMVPDAEDIYG
ncbi:hypothetical protein BDW72DRAFT_177413 [Aspergillus terricola var. indicus]